MPISNQPSKINKISTFIDFIPAELRQTKDWIIVYYAKNPVTDKLERQRLRVPKINNTSERLRFAKKTVVEINNQLLNGWSPYMNESGKNYKSWKDAIAEFKRNLEKQLKDNSLRSDTIRTYNSNLNLIDQFIIDNNIKITFALQYNKAFCLQYIDWIYIQRNNSPRTRNNHLIFLRLLGNYFVDRGILAENPTNGIRNLARQPKKRIYIPKEVRTQIINEADGWSNAFGVVCRTIYYCMIRNTELGKLKVKHININENSIFIPKEISKNKRDEIVSVPDDLKIILKNHIENSNPDHYLFSSNNFFTGEKNNAN